MVRSDRSLAKTALLTVTATLSAFLSAPAAATEIVTICGSQPAIVQAPSGSRDFQLSRVLALSAESTNPIGNTSIALLRDERGFDLVVNWHQQGEHSLRAAGADILGMDLGSLIHLMVADEQKHIEHYLFSLDEDGAGDLLWNSESLREDDAPSSFACTKPR